MILEVPGIIFGGILGSKIYLWGIMGALVGSWGELCASWAALGASWGVLEASWHRFGTQKKPVLIGTGSAFFCCERPVTSCRVWCLVLLRKKN